MPAPTTITKFVVANLTDGLAALRSHFNGTSTLWELDPDVTGNGDTGFVVRQITDTGVGQISMRRTSTTSFLLLIDPTSSITAAGNTSSAPTGAHASQASPEMTYAISTSTTVNFTLLEWPEEVAVLIKTTTSTYAFAIVVGRALAQDWASPDGRYIGDVLTTTSRAQVWNGGTQAENWVTVASLGTGAPAASGGYISSAQLGGRYMPQAEKVGVAAAFREAGRMLQWSRQYPAQTATYRTTNGAGAEIVHVANSGSATQLVVNWKPGVTP